MLTLKDQLEAFMGLKSNLRPPIATFSINNKRVSVAADVLFNCLAGLEIENVLMMAGSRLEISGFRVSSAGVVLNAEYRLNHIDSTVPDALVKKECERKGYPHGIATVPPKYKGEVLEVAQRVNRLLKQQQKFEVNGYRVAPRKKAEVR